MATGSGGNPPPGGGGPGGDKWVAVRIDGLTGAQIAAALSEAAEDGFYKYPVLTPATDGTFIIVSSDYK